MGDTNGNQIRINADQAKVLLDQSRLDLQRIFEKMSDLRKWCSHRREDGAPAVSPWDDESGACVGCGGMISE